MRGSTDWKVPGSDVHVTGQAGGTLSGLRFVAKDLFDVAGHPTGGGNPDWPRHRQVPKVHAWAVQTLLDAGADLVGKSITDEISLGILGENAFDGTPLNPRSPDRVPGGSSSGSASAVARGDCDTALGTDTGGSVRVPSSFCGLYGMRTTHGRLPLDGMAPQAPGSDTTGWFARDATTFTRVGEVLLGGPVAANLPTRLVVAIDAFAFADPGVQAALAPAVAKLGRMLGATREQVMAPQGLSVWGRAQRTLQMAEAWATFGDWVQRDIPRFSFLVARSLMAGSAVSAVDLAAAALMRDEVRGRLAYLVPPGTILCLPTTPGPAPRKGLPLPAMDRVRDRINCLCAQGGLAGHPQLSLPVAELDGAPIGLSILGARGADLDLIAVAQALALQA